MEEQLSEEEKKNLFNILILNKEADNFINNYYNLYMGNIRGKRLLKKLRKQHNMLDPIKEKLGDNHKKKLKRGF
jgi:hypothetical protein